MQAGPGRQRGLARQQAWFCRAGLAVGACRSRLRLWPLLSLRAFLSSRSSNEMMRDSESGREGSQRQRALRQPGRAPLARGHAPRFCSREGGGTEGNVAPRVPPSRPQPGSCRGQF